MFPFRRIQFPLDYSPACLATVPYVQEMARRFHAELILVHSYLAPAFYGAEFGWQAAESFPSTEDIRIQEEKRLQAFAATHFAEFEPRLIARNGYTADLIETIVKHDGADLIMMPTHGHGLFRRMLLGSVTGRVLHDLSCAVWTGSHVEHTELPAHAPYQRVLCAVDLGPDAAAVIQAASKIANAYDAKLTLVHAVLPPASSWEIDAEPYWQSLTIEAETELKAHLAALGIDAGIRILLGPLPETLRAAVTEEKVDLLIVGRGHSQAGVGRIWSSLYGIVRESPCPVLSL